MHGFEVRGGEGGAQSSSFFGGLSALLIVRSQFFLCGIQAEKTILSIYLVAPHQPSPNLTQNKPASTPNQSAAYVEVLGTMNLHQLNPQVLSSMLHANAKAPNPSPQFFDKAANYMMCLDNLNHFDRQAFANILWAYAKIGHPSPQLFDKVANHIVVHDNLNHFDPQAFANILWAYAKVAPLSPQLFNKVANHIVVHDNLNRYTPQELANILWAYAKVDNPSPQLFDKVANHMILLDNLRGFTPQALSNIVWASAKLAFYHDSLFEKIANHLCTEEHLLTTYNGQDFSMLMWAFSEANAEYPLLFEKITEQLLEFDNLNDFTTQSLCNIIGGLNKFTDPPQALMNKVLQTAQQRDEESGQLAMLCKALFPEESEICWISSCTGMCGRKHISDSAVLSILIQLRFERNYRQDGMCKMFVCIDMI